jgi:hypothetical protein
VLQALKSHLTKKQRESGRMTYQEEENAKREGNYTKSEVHYAV